MPRASSRSSLTASVASSRARATSGAAPAGSRLELVLDDPEQHVERHQALLRAVVEVALDAAALVVGGGQDARAGVAEALDALAQVDGARAEHDAREHAEQPRQAVEEVQADQHEHEAERHAGQRGERVVDLPAEEDHRREQHEHGGEEDEQRGGPEHDERGEGDDPIGSFASR